MQTVAKSAFDEIREHYHAYGVTASVRNTLFVINCKEIIYVTLANLLWSSLMVRCRSVVREVLCSNPRLLTSHQGGIFRIFAFGNYAGRYRWLAGFLGISRSLALIFWCFFILTLLHPHRLSRLRCYEPLTNLHSTTFNRNGPRLHVNPDSKDSSYHCGGTEHSSIFSTPPPNNPLGTQTLTLISTSRCGRGAIPTSSAFPEYYRNCVAANFVNTSFGGESSISSSSRRFSDCQQDSDLRVSTEETSDHEHRVREGTSDHETCFRLRSLVRSAATFWVGPIPCNVVGSYSKSIPRETRVFFVKGESTPLNLVAVIDEVTSTSGKEARRRRFHTVYVWRDPAAGVHVAPAEAKGWSLLPDLVLEEEPQNNRRLPLSCSCSDVCICGIYITSIVNVSFDGVASLTECRFCGKNYAQKQVALRHDIHTCMKSPAHLSDVDALTQPAEGWTGVTHAIASASIVHKPQTPQTARVARGAAKCIVFGRHVPFQHDNLNSNSYIREVLEPKILPLLQAIPRDIFQQENARPHVATQFKRWTGGTSKF
ncbi:hypothetical protein PR048_019978 [Dryococelus australis]|uniref:C2H2-type domain-containing protein n=1 Tax=Dryococelus australis TaxID=614101 RepID=A0ABQ9H546_9NEOP|nr:hypothetical protein PR048_019978 [Dryococelus australis]